MPTFGTPGIILKRRNFGEADRILTIFTKRLGKVVGKGHALRKPLSKLAGHLELFTEVDLNLAEGKTWYTVTEAVTLNSFPNLREDIDRVSQAHYLVELVDHLTHEHEPVTEVYQLLHQALNLLNDGKNRLIVPAFTWNLLGQLGYQAELFECVECRTKLASGDLYFSTALGGILDDVHKDKDILAIKIDPQLVKILRLTTRDLGLFYKLKLTPEYEDKFKEIINNFSSHVLDRQLKSLNFLNNLRID